MASHQGIPKYIQVRDAIRNRIQDGTWQPDDRLPAAREFAADFGVTPVTVWKALDELGREHLTYRIQGKGTFVSAPPASLRTDTVGVLMPTDGHCYGKMFSHLVHAVADHGWHTSVGAISLGSAFATGNRERQLAHFQRDDLGGLIVDGMMGMPFQLLAERWPQGRGLTFIHRYERRERLPDANYVLTAWDIGGEVAARHLFERGADRVVLFTFNACRNDSPPGMGDEIHYHWDVRHGIERAIAAVGGDPEHDLSVIVDDGGEATQSALRAVLSQGRAGVLCISDHRAMTVYRVANELGCGMGREVLVTGFFDTPWASAMHPNLTSVNIKEARLADLAAESAIERWHGRRVTVAPLLVCRESTGETGCEAEETSERFIRQESEV